MSVEPGNIQLTDINNPVVGDILEERLEDADLAEILSVLTTSNGFTKLSQQGVEFQRSRANSITSQGTSIRSERLSFDPGSYFMRTKDDSGEEDFYVISSAEGVLVTSEKVGAGFITPEDSTNWSIRDDRFQDLETFLRDEFELTDRTHTVEADEEIFQIPSYSGIVREDGGLPGNVRDSLLDLDNDYLLYRENFENGVGLWTDGEYAVKGRERSGKVVVENFQELEYSIDTGKMDPSNPYLDITDLDDYQGIDFDLFAESVLSMATDTGDGITVGWDGSSQQSVVAWKKNSKESVMEVLGTGKHNLKFTEGVRQVLEDRLEEGNDVDDILTRLGRMTEKPLRDDRFPEHEVGYWKMGGDLRLYTLTPEYDNTTYLAYIGTHQEVQHLYSMNNPSEIQDELETYIEQEMPYLEDHEYFGSHHHALAEVLYGSGHSEDSVDNVLDLLENRLPDVDIHPYKSEFYKMQGVELEDSYDRIDLEINQDYDEIRQILEDPLIDSLDPYNFTELHIDEDTSVALRFRKDDEPEIEL